MVMTGGAVGYQEEQFFVEGMVEGRKAPTPLLVAVRRFGVVAVAVSLLLAGSLPPLAVVRRFGAVVVVVAVVLLSVGSVAPVLVDRRRRKKQCDFPSSAALP